MSLRDPRDAALSSYRFFEGWLFEPGSIDLETFVRERFIGKRGYYTHLMSWWPRRDDDNVLLLGYEHMKTDLGGVVARVADFIGLDGDPELLATAAEQATLAAMTANKSKYDEVIVRELSERRGGLPPGGQTGKVATGQTGGHRDLFSSNSTQRSKLSGTRQFAKILDYPTTTRCLLSSPRPNSRSHRQGRRSADSKPAAGCGHADAFEARISFAVGV